MKYYRNPTYRKLTSAEWSAVKARARADAIGHWLRRRMAVAVRR